MSISAGYLFVGAHHLPHPLDINAPRTDLQIENFRRCFNRLPVNTTEALTVSPSACLNIVANSGVDLSYNSRWRHCAGGSQFLPAERAELFPRAGANGRRSHAGGAQWSTRCQRHAENTRGRLSFWLGQCAGFGRQFELQRNDSRSQEALYAELPIPRFLYLVPFDR